MRARWLCFVALVSLGAGGVAGIPEPPGPWPPPPPKPIPNLPPGPRPSPNGVPNQPFPNPRIPRPPPRFPPSKPPVNIRPIIRPIVVVAKPVVIAGVLVAGGTYIGTHIDGPFRPNGVSTATYVQNAGGWKPVLGTLWNDFLTNDGKGWPWQRPRPPVVVGGGAQLRELPLVKVAVRAE